jgi:heptosyltransferase II
MSRRALIVKLGAIGDVIMALPAVRALYDGGIQIDWVCGSAVFPLLECYSWLKLLPVNDRAILSGTAVERIMGLGNLWQMVAETPYELCATLYYDQRYRVLTLPVRAERKLMLSRASRENLLVPGRSYADEYARVLSGSEDGYNPSSLSPVRPDRLPSALPLPESTRRRVALVPAGASNMLRQQTLRRWPVENYVLVAKELLLRGWDVILMGGPDDVWVRPFFAELKITDCLGRLTLPQVITACDQCDAVISHDTGPLHLAGLSQTPLVGLFGPTDPSNFLPRREFVTGIWGGVNFACRPCYDGSNFAPCKHNGCMHQVTPELVVREMDSLLERKAQGLPSPPRIVFPEIP